MVAETRIRELVEECLDRWDEEGAACVDDVCVRHPEHAERIRRRIDKLLEAGMLVAGAGGQLPEQLGRYRRTRRLGAGGMGVVYAARDVVADRDVALKVVRPEMLLFGTARERFRREVEAAAKLEHPCIIEVFEVGEHEGLPFLAMELVDGPSFAEALIALSDRDAHTLTGRDLYRVVRGAESGAELPALYEGTWVEVVTRICLRIAEALAHAHAHGVVHRDVKPSNVMLTRDGRVLLLDFGLARAEDSVTVTRSGAQLGSLPFMAPEQIRGQRRAIGPHTDVYALGVTMYQALTLRLPFSSPSDEAVRASILAGSPTRVVRLNPRVSLDAMTVCECAMDPDAQRRYPSAAEFAEDLERLLATRPIVARPTASWLRLRRWARRRPALATGACFAILACLVVPLLLVLQGREADDRVEAATKEVEAAEKRVEAAKRVSSKERERGNTHLEAAMQAVTTLLDSIGRRSSSLDLTRADTRKQLRDAIEVCNNAAAIEGDTFAVMVRKARAQRVLGRTHFFLGEYDKATLAFDRAHALFERTRGVAPKGFPLDFNLASLHRYRAQVFRGLEQWEAVRDGLAKARECLKRGAAKYVTDDTVTYLEAQIELDASLAAFHRFRFEEAIAYSSAAIHAFERLEDPAKFRDVAIRMSAAHERIAASHSQLGRWDKAEASMQKCLSVLEASPGPRTPQARRQYALALKSRAVMCLRRGQRDNALTSMAQAVAVWEELAKVTWSRRLDSVWQHALTLAYLARIQFEAKQYEESDRNFESSLRLFDELPEGRSLVVKCERTRIETMSLYAHGLIDRGERRRARALIRDARRAADAALERAPLDAMLHVRSGIIYWDTARLIARRNRAEAAVVKSLEAHRRAGQLGAHKTDLGLFEYGEVLVAYASLLISSRRIDEAVLVLREAVDKARVHRQRILRYKVIADAAHDSRIAELVERASRKSGIARPKQGSPDK